MKREEAKKDLVLFYPRCKMKHENNECFLDTVEVCGIWFDKYPIEKFLLLSPLKCIMIGGFLGESIKPLLFMNQRKPPFKSYQQPQNTHHYYVPFKG